MKCAKQPTVERLTTRVPMLAAVFLLGSLVGMACSDDDGAAVRSAGGAVRTIGPPPPEGGGSVSAVGSGCTTRGATTKLPAASVDVGLDDHTVTAPATLDAGVTRLVVKNFAPTPHQLLVVAASTPAEVTGANGQIDEAALGGRLTKRLETFPGNTICEATFELPAGTYLLLDPEHLERGMLATVTVV